LGLSRPPEPFHRVYSPPEPPPQGRRSTAFGVLTVVVVLVLGTAALMMYGRGDDGTQQAAVRGAPPKAAAPAPPPSSSSPSPSPSSPPSFAASVPKPAREPIFTLAPQACVVVSPATVRRLVPSGTITRGGGPTASTCDYSSKSGSRFRELRVETQIFTSAQSPPAPVDQARSAINSRWKEADKDPVVRTVALEQVSGLGDEAFRRFATDKGQPTVLGEVVMRVRNSVAVISYAEDAPGDDDATVRQRCLTEAVAVAREILPAFE
jgi:hypothetical protein